MPWFRHSPEVRAAQADLNAYSEQQQAAGNHEETDEFLALNNRVNEALRTERDARRRPRS